MKTLNRLFIGLVVVVALVANVFALDLKYIPMNITYGKQCRTVEYDFYNTGNVFKEKKVVYNDVTIMNNRAYVNFDNNDDKSIMILKYLGTTFNSKRVRVDVFHYKNNTQFGTLYVYDHLRKGATAVIGDIVDIDGNFAEKMVGCKAMD